jgi:hypothetical protein
MLNKSITFLILLTMSFLIFSLESRGTTSINIISTSNVKMMPTSSFDIDISVSNPNGLVGFQFKLLYDNTKFKLNTIVVSNGLTNSSFIPNINKEGEIIVTYVDVLKAITQSQNFKLFSLNFTTIGDVSEGDHDLLSIDESYYDEFLIITPEFRISSIENISYSFSKVSRPLKGDVNLDGELKVHDVALIQLHLAGRLQNPLTQLQLLIADVNSDGRISILDAGQIQLVVANLIPGL